LNSLEILIRCFASWSEGRTGNTMIHPRQ
jgi:hypothetical protein